MSDNNLTPEELLTQARELISDLAAQHFKDVPQCTCLLLNRATAWCMHLKDLRKSSSETPASLEPFVVKHYSGDERPSIKGNGFDGLEIGEDREEAEAFISWVNARLAVPTEARQYSKTPGQCGHESATIKCNDCGIDFRNAKPTVPPTNYKQTHHVMITAEGEVSPVEPTTTQVEVMRCITCGAERPFDETGGSHGQEA